MPFAKRAIPLRFSWEVAVEHGREFIEPISSRNAASFWWRACRALREGSGVLMVRSNERVVGVMGSIPLLTDLFLQWRNFPAEHHPPIENELLKLKLGGCRELPFAGLDIAVTNRPRSVAELLRQLDRHGQVAVVRRWHVPVAFLMGIGVLTRLRNERSQVSEWSDGVVDWISLRRDEL